MLKCNTQTQKYIDSFEARKAQQLQQAQGDGKLSDTEGEEADNKALETIMSLVSSLGPTLPPPPSTAAAAADNFLASLKEEADQNARHEKHGIKDNKHRRRDSRWDARQVAEQGLALGCLLASLLQCIASMICRSSNIIHGLQRDFE